MHIKHHRNFQEDKIVALDYRGGPLFSLEDTMIFF